MRPTDWDHLEGGEPVFCATCSKLFALTRGKNDHDGFGRPRCDDCAAKARLTEAVGLASRTQALRQKGELSRLVRLHQRESKSSDVDASGGATGIGGAASSNEADHEGGVAALHNLIILTRRENNELRRRLHAARDEVAPRLADADGASDGAASGGIVAPSAAELAYHAPSGPLASLSMLLDGFIPPQLRTTSRYRPLSDKLVELGTAWRDRERRLGALQGALLAAEATVATLQEELLLVESSGVTLGQLVKAQLGEIAALRQEQTRTLQQVAEAERQAQLAEVRRAEAEAVLKLRHDSEATMRNQARELQRALADAHTSLGSFVTQQQARRAREVQMRQRMLEQWEREMRGLLDAPQRASETRARELAETLEEVLRGGIEEHNQALVALDVRAREGETLEREMYERRIDALEARVANLEQARIEIGTSMDGVHGTSHLRQTELLRKQRDEAFHARELAVDELRQRVVHEGHTLGAMRRSFAEQAEQLSSVLHRLPVSDVTIGDEHAARNALWRRHEASRVRIAQLAFHAWKVRFLAGIWSAWRLATNRSQLKGVSKSVKKFSKDAKQKERRAVAEQADETKKAKEEARRLAKALEEVEGRLSSARGKEDAARATAAGAAVETQSLIHKLEEAEVEVQARMGEAKLATSALEKARHLEALWYEQREALLDESESLRQELELAGKGDEAKAAGKAWQKRANELQEEVEAASRQAGLHRERAEQLQAQLDEAVQAVEAKQEALESLERQRERERAMHEAAQKPENTGERANPYAAVLATGGGCWSPSGAAAFSGNAEGLSIHLHGAGWLAEARDRQARAEALEAEAARWKEHCVRLHRTKVRMRTQQKIWHAWWGLAAASRRRHNERLGKMAEQIVVSADGKASPSKLVDHSEWWERGSKSPTKKSRPRIPKSPLKMAAMV